jgi:hypothetical protein
MANLCGRYQFSNSTLLKQGNPPCKLVVGSRKKPSAQKPKYYLLEAQTTGQYKYLSSLYPIPNEAENSPQAYSMEVQGEHFTLILDREAGQAAITTQKTQL